MLCLWRRLYKQDNNFMCFLYLLQPRIIWKKHSFLVKYVFVIMKSMHFMTTGLTQDLPPKYLSRMFCSESSCFLLSENVERRTHIPQTLNATSVHTESTSVKGKHQRRIRTPPRNGNFWTAEKNRFYDHILQPQVREGEG
jgi:hypothetical protein